MSARENSTADTAQRVLVATDGSPAAIEALHLAHDLVKRNGGSVNVLAVIEPPPVSEQAVGEVFGLTRAQLAKEMASDIQSSIRAQLAEIGGEAGGWPVMVEVGRPAPTIVQTANVKDASLIVIGLGRHSMVDRVLGTETALKVMGLAHIPVLAVPSDARALPTTAVVAVDFTDFSRDAAETTARILPDGAELHLAHVLWSPTSDVEWLGGSEWYEEYGARVRARLDALAAGIDPTGRLTVEAHLLDGGAPGEILRLAYRLRADLVSAGSHGTGFIGRMLMGSVSTRLVRGATCSVLVAPPRDVPAELEPEAAPELVQAHPVATV